MPIVVTASEVQTNFGACHDRALSEPVRVTKHGRETVYIISADTFHAMKQAERAALGSKDLTDEEMALIEASEIPTGHRYSAADSRALPVPAPGLVVSYSSVA
ncbi:type II toxin-antitoxin system prevent-host-death family antitoxin [Plastoroseomonas hellenica]|uniref:type II toxin-antitoxin system prevent-host-death family antitoxin n=1 Tax=Plastoroseomonas hellenica TaxID=2687306 RepID=UPI001BAC45B6|nr:type II toxin-antitoxin system prevent-host-death family antitoxin [Plastoroseomonas hellenica]MBR0641208.1 type II toxin-antitoxin system Phd/YefM family antitoxin [Plastoroseomonas hellenica]